jgi:superfamily II DNA or RNA helicase
LCKAEAPRRQAKTSSPLVHHRHRLLVYCQLNISPRSPTKRRRQASDLPDEDEDTKELQDSSHFITRWTVSPPFVKNGTMKDYQVAGLNWLIKLYDNGINGILADEMGLGKTLQTIAFLGYLKEVRNTPGPHIVVAPKSTLPNWLNEFAKWVPSLRVFGFHGSQEQRAEQRDKQLIAGKFDAIVTTYEIAIKEKAALKKFKWHYLIIDEAHRIKNENSVLSQVVRMYDSSFRLLITGTPLQNNLHELWALLNFLLPDVFSSADDFDSWFDLTSGDNQQEIINRLHAVLRPFLLRRKKSEVAVGLPPKTEVKVYVGLTELQKEWYTKLLLKDIDSINAGALSKGGAPKTRLLNILMQLRKCCNHPYLFPSAEPGPPFEDGPHLVESCGKLLVLDKLLQRLKQRGSRVLLFSQMTRLLDLLEDYLVWRQYEYCRIDGNTDTVDRAQAIEDFNQDGSSKFVFLLSTRAGGLGINLATADTVVLYDSDWNPQMDLQAQDRAHRIGQTKPVTVYRLVTEGTVEEKIVERAETKLRLDAMVIQQGRLVDQNRALSKNEMLAMIKYGADEIFKSKAATVTDADIDAIIAKGEQKTKELENKISKNATDLLSSVVDDETNFDMWTFDGVDYKNSKIGPAQRLGFLEPPKRQKNKQTYNEQDYFRSKLQANSGNRKAAPRGPKVTQVFPHQFFPKRIYQLVEKEAVAKQKFVQAEKDREEDIKRRADAEAQGATHLPEVRPSPDPEEPALTAEEEAEKNALLSEGFKAWTKREFNDFIKACGDFGRNQFESIARAIGTKSADEVESYSSVFWKRYSEIPDHDKLVTLIERGEIKIAKKIQSAEFLRRKIAATPMPYLNLKIPYPQNYKPGLHEEQEDVFLLCATDKVGHGNPDAVRLEVRNSWQLRCVPLKITSTPVF